MNHVSLFSGIGGLDLAGHWAGMESLLFCEREPFAQQILRKHWPDVPIIDDVHNVTREEAERLGIRAVDIVSAGFPCQPFSHAGKRGGTDDDRYLWPQVVRVLSELRPPWFVGENVAGLLSMAEPDGPPNVVSRTNYRTPEEDYLESIFTQAEIMLIYRICKDLEDIGYEVQVYVFPAAAVDAKNLRERVFILGYSERGRLRGKSRRRTGEKLTDGHRGMEGGYVANSEGEQLNRAEHPRRRGAGFANGSSMAYSESERCGETRECVVGRCSTRSSWSSKKDVADTESKRCNHGNDRKDKWSTNREIDTSTNASASSFTGWSTQSGMGRNPNVLSSWMDRNGINPLDELVKFIATYPQPALLGQAQQDWEPPRVAVGVKDRAPRLKALGNAVNPLQIFPIMYAIKVIDNWLRRERT